MENVLSYLDKLKLEGLNKSDNKKNNEEYDSSECESLCLDDIYCSSDDDNNNNNNNNNNNMKLATRRKCEYCEMMNTKCLIL
jgi:hypothetical protein